MDNLKTIDELWHEFGTTDYVKIGGGNTLVKNETTLWDCKGMAQQSPSPTDAGPRRLHPRISITHSFRGGSEQEITDSRSVLPIGFYCYA